MKHILKKHGIAGFTLYESLYPPKLKQPRHTHPLASFSFVLAGAYVENYGSRAWTRQPSTVIFHPPQESHAVDFQSGARILSVEIDFKRLAYIRERSVILDSSVSCRTEKITCLGRRIHQEFRQTDTLSALAIESLIFEILVEASRNKITASEGKSPRWLEQVREFLHDNFSEPFSHEVVAEIADVHPVHLARVFRQKYECTIGEYVRRLRVEFACRQISSSDYSLSEIALAAGFTDQSHFVRIFKNHLGVTPGEYRKILRSC
ncbi:MAG: AraC family transcriptional regulator [Acidobacteria bacterium]|nr:AraC family transcriptional regulator [Acidobacteriota bacterium]